MKTPRNLVFLLGLSVAACPNNIIPADKPIETPQIEHIEAPQIFESCVEEEFVPECFPLNDCTSPYNITVQEPERKQTLEDVIDKRYEEMMNNGWERRALKRRVKRAKRYERRIIRYAAWHGIEDINQIKAHMIIESEVRQLNESGKIITSRVGALGIMQLMPGTAEELGVNPHILRQNIWGGIDYISRNLEHYNGKIVPAITAYNAGPNRTDDLIRKAGSDDFLDYTDDRITTNKEIKRYTLNVLTVKKYLDILDPWK